MSLAVKIAAEHNQPWGTWLPRPLCFRAPRVHSESASIANGVWRGHNVAGLMGNEFIQRVGPATIDQTLRFLRIFHGCLMVSIGLYVVALRIVPRQSMRPSVASFPLYFGVLAAVMIVLGFGVRSRLIGSSFDVLRMRPDDAAALERWRQGVMVGDVLAEGVALYGVALYFLGGQIWQVAAFLIAGELLMVLWWPRRP